MKHLKQYGKFLTPELKDQLGVPLCSKSLELGSTLTTEELDHHVVLGALVFDRIWGEERKEGFLDLHDAFRKAEAQIREEHKLNKDNSMVIVRGANMTREHIDLFHRTVELFFERMFEGCHHYMNYIDSGKVSQYHRFVQFLYIDEAITKAINDMEETLPLVPCEEIDVPAN
uniref:Uncharacterized protein n=1 Tax=Pseudomonas phage RVTF4 TaxID=3236931 RepID=A0AB39CCC2_9VIRU